MTKAPQIPHTLRLFSLVHHSLDAGVHSSLLFRHWLEEWVLATATVHPFVKLPDIGCMVKHRSRSHHICVDGEEAVTDDAPPHVLPLEVRVGEAKEHLLQLALPEIIGEELHRIRPDDGHVVMRRLTVSTSAQCTHPLPDIVRDLLADLQAEHQLVRELWAKRNQKASVATTDVKEADGRSTAARERCSDRCGGVGDGALRCVEPEGVLAR
mmetsp:Transcript_28423/g.61918  ORF Transcript_28423/g.61918 Transcript_28423/m.61918 type:complete len:211 (+) Transcript_28423:225-857(+)